MAHHQFLSNVDETNSSFFCHDPRIAYLEKGASIQNFGDFLPPLIAQSLLLHAKVEADLYRLVGSVIEKSWIRHDLRSATGTEEGRLAYWGCGKRTAEPLPPESQAKCMFFSVRGPLTRDVLGLPADTVLGDPGLLAPLFHQPSLSQETQGRSICIPHLHDPRDPAELLASSGAELLVSPLVAGTEEGLRGILDKIASAAFVLTNSLHGAIIAAAYRRPFAFWADGHLDVPFKWQDFAASVGIPTLFAKTLDEGREVYADVIAPRIALLPLAPILDACPFAARPSALLRALVLDGEIDEGAVLPGIRALDRLPSLDIAAVQRSRHASETYHAARTALGDLARRRVGRGTRTVKRALRNALGL